MGAGTFHPATTLRALGPRPWHAAYVQPSRRPKDGRYGENPNRLQHYYQFQVILKPAPADMCRSFIWARCAPSGSIPTLHDIRFVEDDWESPTLGAWGLGWEVWCDGMEITQFTYFQQVGGIDCDPVSARDHLWPRAPGHVCAERRVRLRPRLQRAVPLRRSVPPEREGILAPTISSAPTPRSCSSISRMRRNSAANCSSGDKKLRAARL